MRAVRPFRSLNAARRCARIDPESIQPKHTQMVASTWLTPGCVQFLENRKRFHTAWVIRDRVVPAASLVMSAVHRKRLNCCAAKKRRDVPKPDSSASVSLR